jgi:hypothetical protein
MSTHSSANNLQHTTLFLHVNNHHRNTIAGHEAYSVPVPDNRVYTVSDTVPTVTVSGQRITRVSAVSVAHVFGPCRARWRSHTCKRRVQHVHQCFEPVYALYTCLTEAVAHG